MPIHHSCEQYSDEYDRLKLGLPTSSNFFKIVTPSGEPSKQWKPYAYHLIAERVLDRKVNTYTSPYMERALGRESEAARWYEFDQAVEAAKIGFITNDAGTIGCSPDRLIGDDGLLEIKCLQPQTQVEYFIEGKAQRKHKPQLQGQLYISERQWVDILAYTEEPNLPKIVVRVERDEVFIRTLARELAGVIDFIERVMEKFGHVSQRQLPRAELKEMLRASLEIVP